MQPCKPNCEYYLYFIAESKRLNKPIQYRLDIAE